MDTNKQWVDLGVQTQACLVLPETCGPEGAAVALRLYHRSCDDDGGFMSSRETLETGFIIYCFGPQHLM